jgi:hypothetical protein
MSDIYRFYGAEFVKVRAIGKEQGEPAWLRDPVDVFSRLRAVSSGQVSTPESEPLAPLFSGPKPSVFDSRAHSAPMETHAFGFRLRASAPERQKRRFHISSCGSCRGGNHNEIKAVAMQTDAAPKRRLKHRDSSLWGTRRIGASPPGRAARGPLRGSHLPQCQGSVGYAQTGDVCVRTISWSTPSAASSVARSRSTV